MQQSAARLAKADQASRLVGEFAELEGYVGAVYARRAGLPEPVAVAISEQYLPAAAGAAPPSSVAGALVALADKLDSLATAFGLGEQPTGSRDPYGLRRAAAGVVSIVLDRGWSLDLADLVALDLEEHVEQGSDMRRVADEVVAEVVAFVLDRVDAALAAEGVPTETQRAARGAGGADPLAHAELARALHAAGPSSRRRGRDSSAAGALLSGGRPRRRRRLRPGCSGTRRRLSWLARSMTSRPGSRPRRHGVISRRGSRRRPSSRRRSTASSRT